MTNGLRAAAAAMSVQIRKHEVYSANLANAGTVGYLRTEPVVGSFAVHLAHAASQPVGQATQVDPAQGPIYQTGDPCDLALNGPGMFTLLTPAGMRYSRDGRFRVDADGRLVSLRGHQVMGRHGPIVVGRAEFTVTQAGEVFADGQLVDHLLIARCDGAQQLSRTADGLFTIAGAPRAAEQVTVHQGCLEQANVSVVQEMAHMIASLRAFEAGAVALRVTDQTLGTLIDATRA